MRCGQAFQRLGVRGELEVGSQAVAGQRRIDARDLERRAVEVRRRGRSGECHGDGVEIGGSSHGGGSVGSITAYPRQ
jgi:hypothetical protein